MTAPVRSPPDNNDRHPGGQARKERGGDVPLVDQDPGDLVRQRVHLAGVRVSRVPVRDKQRPADVADVRDHAVQGIVAAERARIVTGPARALHADDADRLPVPAGQAPLSGVPSAAGFLEVHPGRVTLLATRLCLLRQWAATPATDLPSSWSVSVL